MTYSIGFIMTHTSTLKLLVQISKRQSVSKIAKKIFAATLLTGTALTALANENAQCLDSTSQIKADYNIRIIPLANANVHSHVQYNPKDLSQTFTLWRMDNLVAHQQHNIQITEVWHQTSNQQYQLIKHFDQYSRAIEYEPSDYKILDKVVFWDTKYSLFPLAEQFVQTQKESFDCYDLITYEKNTEQTKEKILWRTDVNLAVGYQSENPNRIITWKMQEMNHNPQQVADFFKEKRNDPTIDYADIGDNENDPFLAQMINQGFVAHSH